MECWTLTIRQLALRRLAVLLAVAVTAALLAAPAAAAPGGLAPLDDDTPTHGTDDTSYASNGESVGPGGLAEPEPVARTGAATYTMTVATPDGTAPDGLVASTGADDVEAVAATLEDGAFLAVLIIDDADDPTEFRFDRRDGVHRVVCRRTGSVVGAARMCRVGDLGHPAAPGPQIARCRKKRRLRVVRDPASLRPDRCGGAIRRSWSSCRRWSGNCRNSGATTRCCCSTAPRDTTRRRHTWSRPPAPTTRHTTSTCNASRSCWCPMILCSVPTPARHCRSPRHGRPHRPRPRSTPQAR